MRTLFQEYNKNILSVNLTPKKKKRSLIKWSLDTVNNNPQNVDKTC